ncbi:MAG: threonine--tRNA ligase [Euryarchaeota archaeon RBG_19FT_COMBO_56_21]|nr:MAG: threonine--tRNA ligase [Euryarchaeota archaeon RBG_19FT_COMBO_56_21]
MRVLLIHADRFEYEVKEPTKMAEPLPEKQPKKHAFEEVLVSFTTVEESDEDVETIADVASADLADVFSRVKAQRLVLYPYAHLSPNLASPKLAVDVLKAVEQALRDKGIDVHRSPFGWYKGFEIKCKGHPLSELSREYTAEKKVTREEVVEKIQKTFYILTPEGQEHALDIENLESMGFLDRYPSLKTFILSEEVGRKKGEEPPSIKAMQRLELVDYEEASDRGHFRMFPKGHLIFKLLEEWAQWIAIEKIGAIQIDTPILYDWSYPDIRSQGLSFHERHYTLKTEENREFVLRFAGDFGLFRMMKGATLSYRNLPLRVYEFSKSFRLEQRGELTGLKRLRAFHMPDVHCFTKDIEEGWKEYMLLYKNYADLADATGVEYAVAFRIVKEFYDKYKDNIIELLKYSKKPALIEVLSEMKHYWAVKHEFQGIDAVGGAVQLSTVQLDVADAERYGIVYTDQDGKKKGCIICHSSIGSIERWIYVLLEEALKHEKPSLPFWISPTQIRLIPVASEFLPECEKLSKELRARVDIDDMDDKVGKKIRNAEMEWIPMIIVIGAKEKSSGLFPVRLRSGEQKMMTLDQLKAEVASLSKDYPTARLPLPAHLSRRPTFRG